MIRGSRPKRSVAWHSASRSLEKVGVPREFVTQSRVIIIFNDCERSIEMSQLFKTGATCFSFARDQSRFTPKLANGFTTRRFYTGSQTIFIA